MTGQIPRRRGRLRDRAVPVPFHTPFRRDCALAVLIALGSVGLLWMPDRTVPPVPELALLGAQSLALCLRRVYPQLCLALAMVLQAGLAAVVPHGNGVRGIALTVAVYTCGTLLPVRRALGLAAAAVLAEIGSYVALSAVPAFHAHQLEGLAALAGTQFLLAVLWYGGASLIGQNVAGRRRYAALVVIRAAEAAEAQRERVRAALVAERSRMARELHDVAAHHLTSLIVQASLVERLVGRDPEAARRGAAAAREEGRKALNDLRFVVSALREPDSPEGGAPVPGLDRLADFAADDDVTMVVGGEPADRSAAVDLTIYRVAQEALSNARDHAPGAAIVIAVRHGDQDLTLEVRNGPGTRRPGPPDRTHRGFGLIGMRERAALIGATLDAGPAPDGGWSVRLTVPSTQGGEHT
jgi:signal transduction histidine kinase